MFDEDSFSVEAFDSRSWLMGLVDTVKRYVRTLTSSVTKVINLVSRL